MRSTTLVLAVAALSCSVAAQNSTVGTTCCTINPSSVQSSQRQAWCRAERNACLQLCKNQPSENNCDDSLLTYSCICADGTKPNVSDYSNTLPSLLCEEWKNQCVANHPSDLDGQTQCLSVVCGSKSVSQAAAAASSSAAAASASATAARTSGSSATSTSTAKPTTSSAAAIALYAAKNYGTGALAAGLLALFGLAM